MYSVEDIDMIWMRYALVLAKYASTVGEVSVGAVLVRSGKLIGYGWNVSIESHDPCGHAEIVAMRMGGKMIGNYRLIGSALYVTLEPCIMCIGAIINARINRLICGARSNRIRWVNQLSTILYYPMLNHHVNLTLQVLEKECAIQLNNFFKLKREK